jgi:DNA modification methylase
MADMRRALGLSLFNICVWSKTQAGQGSFYRSQHELIYVFKKGKAQHLNRIELGRHGRSRSNIWSYQSVSGLVRSSRVEHEKHPTPKSLAMVEDALLDCTEKGDLVIDVFGGSGTTLMAAERTGRRARLLEIDPGYVDVIIERWQNYTGRQAKLAGSGLTFVQVRAQRAEARAQLAEPPSPTPPSARVRTRIRPTGAK